MSDISQTSSKRIKTVNRVEKVENLLAYLHQNFKFVPEVFSTYLKLNQFLIPCFQIMSNLDKYCDAIEESINMRIHLYGIPLEQNTSGLTGSYKLSLMERYYIEQVACNIKQLGVEFYGDVLKDTYKPVSNGIHLNKIINELEKRGNSSLLATVLRNIAKNTKEYSYELKEVALYAYIHGGAKFYSFFHKNLAFPSISTVKRFLSNEFEGVKEGKLRVKELAEWLDKHNLPKKVFISEDATRVIRKISYDPKTGRLVGFKPSLDANGLPIENEYEATDKATIDKLFEEREQSNLLYVIMAQPLLDKAPSFTLSTFAQPDFNHKTCINRICFIKTELLKYNIDVIGWSTDGDAKCLKAMCLLSKIGDSKNKIPWQFREFINVDLDTFIPCIQDERHICNKLKNRLFKESRPIIMGYGKKACISDLKNLDKLNLKYSTRLSSNDLINCDSMSSNQALKLSSEAVINALYDTDKHGTHATRLYLFLIQQQHEAFSCKTLTPSERIFKLFFIVFIFRAIHNERKYFSKHIKDYDYSHFITSNAYKCIELNAANLLIIARNLRERNDDQYFLPWLFQSQTCESFFRLLRSFTPNQSTVTNFSTLDSQYRMTRIQTLIDLGLSLSENGYKMPGHAVEEHLNEVSNHKIPNDEILLQEIRKARDEAMKILDEFLTRPIEDNAISMQESLTLDDSLFEYLYKETVEIEEQDNEEELVESIIINYDTNFENEQDEVIHDVDMCSDIDTLLECEHLLNNDMITGETIESSNYICLKDDTGKRYYITKKTYIWVKNNSIGRLSNDRIQKFRSMSSKTCQFYRNENTNIEKMNNIMILDFIILKKSIAQVLDFKYIGNEGKKTIKSYKYKSNILELENNNRRVGLLVNFYKLEKAKNAYILHVCNDTNELFIDSKYYVSHLPVPKYVEGQKRYSLEIGRKILNLIQ